MADLNTHIKAAQGFLNQSDGRDKLLAAVQYAAMFISAGTPGDAKKVQASVAAARKVFRILRPLESLSPLVLNPTINPKKPIFIEILNKIKPILMSIYFGGDHVVWASQAGLLANKDITSRAQKTSLYGWFGGSLCTIVTEIYESNRITMQRKDESNEEYTTRQAAEAAELRRHAIIFWHAVFQALLAMGLLELRPWKPRTVGALGIIASVMNCYMLYPSLPRPVSGGLFSSSKRAGAPAALPSGAVTAAGEKFAKGL
ncbi:hypothetical protein Ndes2437B_g05463 [Nannochloris sp. 'desiccata']|nr:hypothetical protein KSW81_007474 [Chlorella desiccata (nom. nud.)]